MLANLLENADKRRLLKLQQTLVELLPDTVEVELWKPPHADWAIRVSRTDRPDKIVSLSFYNDDIELMGSLKAFRKLGDVIIGVYNKLGWVSSVDYSVKLKARANELWDVV